MIGFFPEPYPDELLYSVCARYAQRVNYPNKAIAIRDLFGKRGLSAIIDFPTRLESFLSAIPHHNYSTDDIIDKNTLFPFYEPFITAERAANIREEMKNLNDNHLQTRLATNVRQVKKPEFLRFCPLCLKNDREEYGETYWHRIHQLTGIMVCPLHKCFLSNSKIRWERESSTLFHSAENILTEEKACFLDDNNPTHQVFHYLAANAEWLLNQKKLSLNPGELRERYYNMLLQRGYAFYSGKIRSSELYEAFTKFFKAEIFEEIGCPLKASYKTWLPRLIDKTYTAVLYHPIRHLLLLKFLETDAKNFFHNFVEFKPFGTEPYPCLNRVALHYKELRIKSCQVFDNTTKKAKTRRPIAIFSCDCGFIYQRAGPDVSSNDKFRYDIVRNYGEVWEAALTEQWQNLDLSLAEMGRRFGTTTHLIARHAIRLKLPMNAVGTRNLEGYTRYRNPNTYLTEEIRKRRKKWLKVIRKYPSDSRRQLLHKSNTLYLWLQKNDSEWFNSNLPKQIKVGKKVELLDWKKIDAELVEKIQKACKEIRVSPDKPTRVSITEIIRRVGYKKWIEKRHLKLPLTSKLLEQQLETLEDFMIRKIKWAMTEYIKNKKVPTRLQLMARATVRNKTTENSLKTQNAIVKALEEISESTEL